MFYCLLYKCAYYFDCLAILFSIYLAKMKLLKITSSYFYFVCINLIPIHNIFNMLHLSKRPIFNTPLSQCIDFLAVVLRCS